MKNIGYYRGQAAWARRLAQHLASHPERTKRQLLDMAQDYEDIANDLDAGIDLRNPPQIRQ